MKETSLAASISCHDHAELLQLERIIWSENDEYMAFSIMDSYVGRNQYQGLSGRLRRAWRVFFAKPICYAEIIVMEKERVRRFLNECRAVLDAEVGGESHDKAHSAEQTE